MTDQLKGKGKSFQWGDAQRKSFETLKFAIAAAPTLKVVDPNQPFELETDASNEAVGEILTQGRRPIAFESKKLNRTQRNYSAYERELFAIACLYSLSESDELVSICISRSFGCGSVGPRIGARETVGALLDPASCSSFVQTSSFRLFFSSFATLIDSSHAASN